MAESIPWLKSIQGVGRGIRPGTELQVMTAGTNGKSLVADIESDVFNPWRDAMRWCSRPHYAEYLDVDTGETYWKKFNREPKTADMHRANNIVRKNEDGTYEYVKSRKIGGLRKLTEKEIMWMLLHV